MKKTKTKLRRPADSALAEICRERITFAASVTPAQRRVLHNALIRTLDTPTAPDLAQQFFDEGGAATIEIIDEASSDTSDIGADAHCTWESGSARISLRGTYLNRGRDIIAQTLPAVLAHELLSHGLWQARAEREGIGQALRHHDLEEVHARLVGWLVDIELDDRISSDKLVQHFLDDPDQCLARLKLRTPYYALKFSSAEMHAVPATLGARALAARARRDELAQALSNTQSWPAVVQHFVREHGVDERRMHQLRRQLAEDEEILLRDIANIDAVIAELDLRVEKFRAETDGASERYLRQAAAHPLFSRLSQEAAMLTRRLRDRIDQCANDPFSEPAAARRRREKRWRGQVDFAELRAMYADDLQRRPDHWQSKPRAD